MVNKSRLPNLFSFLFICYLFLLILSSFSIVYAEDIAVALDPTRLGVGARFLGMGKWGIALGDDCNSIFLNPAGLSSLDDWQISSMAGKFINEVNFIELSGVYHISPGTIGVGYVGSNISFSTPATILTPEGGVIPDPSGGSYNYSYHNDAILLSYGLELKDIWGWDLVKDTSFGANLKIFSAGLSGSGIEKGTATGQELDMGILWKPYKWLQVGATGQDILPFNMGGKLTWATGKEENYPASGKIGFSAKVLGKDAPYQYETQELYIGIDSEFSLQKDTKVLNRLGIEWWPMIYLAIRAGIDQDHVGSGAEEPANNVTAGIGLLFGGFRFDYAYHQYNNISENDTHYFSLSYNIWKELPEKPAKKIDKHIEVIEPADKSIVYTDTITLVGKVYNPEIRKIKVAGHLVEVDKLGTFKANLRLMVYGKNSIPVEGLSKDNKPIKTLIHRVLKLRTFKDIAEDYWAKLPVETLATFLIMTGYPDGTFKPYDTITRAELTAILLRTKGNIIDIPEEAPFSDVPVTHWAAKYITIAKKDNIVTGYPNNLFKPNNVISRVEGTAIMARFAKLPEPEAIIESPFTDLPGRHWASRTVTAAKRAGILKYLEGKLFEPNKGLTRGEASEILSKISPLKERIQNLLDFEIGYQYPSKEAVPVIVGMEAPVAPSPALVPQKEIIPVKIETPVAKAAPVVPLVIEYIKIKEPLDNTVISTGEDVKVAGTVSSDVYELYINDQSVIIEKTMIFSKTIKVNAGKNTLIITAKDKTKKIISEIKLNVYKI